MRPCLLAVAMTAWMLCLWRGPMCRAAVPVVTVTAQRAAASEAGPTPGLFRVTRAGDLSAPLSVDFSLTGPATAGTDYLCWEPRAVFPAGAETAWIAVLPRNDALAEGDEAVTLTLAAAPGYVVGAPNAATVTIADAFQPGFAGVWDTPDVRPDTGEPFLDVGLAALDAVIADGCLNVAVVFSRPFDMLTNLNVNLYVDADQDPATGDYRLGRLGGQEFRVNLEQLTETFWVYGLRTLPPENSSENERNDTGGESGALTVDRDAGTLRASIPLALLGGGPAMDVFVVCNQRGQSSGDAEGDRCPDYGALDTASRQVVARRVGVTQCAHLPDPAGDSPHTGTYDLTGLTVTTIADQFHFTLTFAEPFGPGSGTFNKSPMGAISVDGDADLMTGWLPMGDAIASWGGDVWFYYWVAERNLPLNFFTLTISPIGVKEELGVDDNDGRFVVYAPDRTLTISGSLSLLDGERRGSENGQTVSARVPTSGRMLLQAETAWYTDFSDGAPAPGRVFDPATGQVHPPLEWDPDATISAEDPAEYGIVGCADLTRADVQVTGDCLIVKGTVGSWLNTETENVFEVALDLDMDAATGLRYENPMNGGPPIGADAIVVVSSFDNYTGVIYLAELHVPPPHGPSVLMHDAWLRVRTNSLYSEPGYFTVTIPRRALPTLGPRLRMYLASTYAGFPEYIDLAPPQPLVVELSAPLTFADAFRALRAAAGLAPLDPSDLPRLDALPGDGVGLPDVVSIARKAAGLEPDP